MPQRLLERKLSHKPIVFLFSGQGSHYYQMGRALFEEEFYFRAWMEKGERLAQARFGLSILEKLYAPNRKKSNRFDRTRFSHPAIFLVEYSLAQTLIEQGLEPDSLSKVKGLPDALHKKARTFTRRAPLSIQASVVSTSKRGSRPS